MKYDKSPYLNEIKKDCGIPTTKQPKGINVPPGVVDVSRTLIGTSGLGPCNGLVIYDNVERIAAVAHVTSLEEDTQNLVEHMVRRIGTQNEYQSVIVQSLAADGDLSKRLEVALMSNPRIKSHYKHTLWEGFEFYFNPRTGRFI